MGLDSRLAGFVNPGRTHVYFFLDDSFVQFDLARGAVDPGYPQSIDGRWPGVFTDDIDTALSWPDGSVYFFKGEEYIKYDYAAGHAAEGYPLPIAAMWPGLFKSDLSAAVRWTGDVVYFFRGSEYLTYDLLAGRVVGDPAPIVDDWPGLTESGVDVALVLPDDHAYFFHTNRFQPSGQYSRYDIEAGRVEEGYPRPVEGSWPGLHLESTRGGPRLGSAPTSSRGTPTPPAGDLQHDTQPHDSAG